MNSAAELSAIIQERFRALHDARPLPKHQYNKDAPQELESSMKLELEIIPFYTPKYVTVSLPPQPKQDGLHLGPDIPLNALTEDALSRLCDEFRQSVFAEAGKTDPKA